MALSPAIEIYQFRVYLREISPMMGISQKRT